jgi:crotonobetaine/carnitine-CoA ligase
MTVDERPSAITAPRRTRTLLADVLRRRAAEHPDRRFLWCGDETRTFGEADRRSESIANALAELGVEAGERVAILTPNRIEMLELLFALAKRGAIQVPLNAYLKGQFLRYQLDDSQASTLICDAAGWRAAQPLLAHLPALRRIVHLDAQSDPAPPSIVAIDYESLALAPADRTLPTPTLDDISSIVYTSGTTGLPKGCALSHGYYARVAHRGVEWQGVTEDDVYLTMMPLFHAAARMIMVGASLVAGATVAVEPEFSPSRILSRARETGATIYGGVGAMGVALLNQPPTDRDRDHQLRTMWFVPFSVAQQDEVTRRFGVATQCELYGQTECFPLTFNPLTGPRNRDSDGREAGDLEVRLIDEHGDEVPVGQAGEIVVRPRERHAMFAGYWGKPEATLEAFRDLWYHTGDFGRADADGFVRFVDRKKDTIRRRGENVASLELETAIAAHPAVAEVAVLAVPSEVSEDDIKACIVLAPDATVEVEELFDYFKQNLPYFAIPRYVEYLPELPRNAVARVMKHELRAAGITPSTIDLQLLGLTVARAERR